LFYFEELKKPTKSNITGRTVNALLTEELLEKIMLAKTKHKKLWKFYVTLPNKGNNNGTVLQGAFKRESPQKQTKPIRSSTI
jgi:hypothetical protein